MARSLHHEWDTTKPATPSASGAASSQPRATPWVIGLPKNKGLKARPILHPFTNRHTMSRLWTGVNPVYSNK